MANKEEFIIDYALNLSQDEMDDFLKWSESYFKKKVPSIAKEFESLSTLENGGKAFSYLSKKNNKTQFLTAWRQAKRRKKSIRTVTIDLDKKTYQMLKFSAKKKNISMNQFLIALIKENHEKIL